MTKIIKLYIFLLMIPFLNCCSPEKNSLKVVENVELEKYTGTWYEIARLSWTFQR